MTLEARLKDRIRSHGPISVAEYMEAALGDAQEGYYMHRNPLGLAGDFVTSPEISQVFGELIGIWCAECWRLQATPHADAVEMGPGRGTLMADWLRATCSIPGFHDALDVQMVEMSGVLRAEQQCQLQGKHPRLSWHETLPQAEKPLFLVANEFFDALPIRQFMVTKDGFCERLVGLSNGDFIFTLSDKHTELTESHAGLRAENLPEGTVIEICLPAQRIMREIAARIVSYGGAALFIDYGYTHNATHGLYATGDTLQAVRSHEYHHVLRHPGEADVTAHVDFSTLSKVAEEVGAHASSVLTQREFLLRMGGKLRVEQLCRSANSPENRQNIVSAFERLIAREGMGTLFRVLAITPASFLPPVFE